MAQNKKVVIVGGGITGLASAYYVSQKGYQVKVIDRRSIGDSCAAGNAGYVTPSHFIPLAAPGMIKKGLKWMLNPESPFYIHPRFDKSLIQWLWRFYQHCNAGHVNKVKQTLYELCCESKRLHLELAQDIGNSYQLKQNGIYVVTQDPKTLREELEIVEQAQVLGLNASAVSVEQLDAQFPDLQLDVEGGIFFPEDAHLQPAELLSSLYKHLKSVGVEFVEGVDVGKFNISNGQINAVEYQCLASGLSTLEEVDELVIAGGSWSPQLFQQLKLDVPIQAGKGYSVTIDKPWEIDVPIILSDAAVAITPFEKQIRFGGTMEFAGLNSSISVRRVNGILKSVKRFIPSFEPDKIEKNIAWSGLRPCTPDGLPLIGPVPKLSNVFLAAGHAMLGLTLAPVTGKIIAELIDKKPNSDAIQGLSHYQNWCQHLAVDRF